MTDVQSGPVDATDLLAFLEQTFDGWGDEALLEWKYDRYPGFDPDEHCYFVADDELAAFRRVFPKELVVDGERIQTAVFGDTAVRPDRRGEGLYSTLYERTAEYCHDGGPQLSITYNHVGNVTYRTKRDRGWNHCVLPVKLCIHSYATVLETYADLALADGSPISRALETVGDRFVLETPGEPVVVSSLAGGGGDGDDGSYGGDSGGGSGGDNDGDGDGTDPTQLRVPVAVNARAIARLVERVSNDSVFEVATTGMRLLVERDVRPFERRIERPPAARSEPDAHDDTAEVAVVDPADLTDDQLTAMLECCRLTRVGAASFRRERRDLEHLLAYPDASVLLATDGGDLAGFAVVGPYETDGVLEARVLELAAPSRAIYRRLVSTLEAFTAAEGYDLVVMLSRRDPGPAWASIERQVMMWSDHGGGADASLTECRFEPIVTFYDVL